MRAAAALSQHPVAALATGEIAGVILERLADEPIDLLVVFLDSSHTGSIEDIAGALRQLLSPRVMIGSTACGVIGQTSEVEDAPAISVWAATGIDATPIRIDAGQLEPGGGWPNANSTGIDMVILADPFTTAVDEVLTSAAHEVPNHRIHGGLSSAARGPGGNRLLLDGAIFTDGAVGVALGTGLRRSVVSQGCRPLDNAYTVTGCAGNVITELASQRPLDVLERIAREASPEDQRLLAAGIHVGLVVNEAQVDDFGRGDFLIRSVLGADPATGAIAIGAEVEVGTTVQFHVRDAESASDDLVGRLGSLDGGDAIATLTFTCNGRGLHLFGFSGHDAEIIHASTGAQASAGMFCAGEFGPVGAANHMHAFTASTIVFG